MPHTLDQVQTISCDEAFLDITTLVCPLEPNRSLLVPHVNDGSDQLPTPESQVALLRQTIYRETGLRVSAGIAKNKLLARMCTKVAKPDGQKVLREHEISRFLHDHKVQDLPQIGHRLAKTMNELNLQTIDDLQGMSENNLKQTFGDKRGMQFYIWCRGIDHAEVVNQPRKSVSVAINYGVRLATEDQVKEEVHQVTEEAHRRLCTLGYRAKKITLQVMKAREEQFETPAAGQPRPYKFNGHGPCHKYSKCTPINEWGSLDDLKSVVLQLYASIAQKQGITPKHDRGFGVSFTGLVKRQQHQQHRQVCMFSCFPLCTVRTAASRHVNLSLLVRPTSVRNVFRFRKY